MKCTEQVHPQTQKYVSGCLGLGGRRNGSDGSWVRCLFEKDERVLEEDSGDGADSANLLKSLRFRHKLCTLWQETGLLFIG